MSGEWLRSSSDRAVVGGGSRNQRPAASLNAATDGLIAALEPETQLLQPEAATDSASSAASTGSNGKPAGDIFAGISPPMPRLLSNPLRRLACLVLVSLACSIASGPTQSWSTLEPVLIDMGVFKSSSSRPGNGTTTPPSKKNSSDMYGHRVIGLALPGAPIARPMRPTRPMSPSNVSSLAPNGTGPPDDDPEQQYQLSTCYSLAMGLAVGTNFITGLVFDRFGPRTSGVVGGGLAAVGLVFMAIAVTFRRHNWMLYWAYPLTSIGGALNTYSVFAFVWVFPRHQGLISSLGAGVTALSDSLAVVGVWLHDSYGVPLTTFFYALAGSCSFAVFLCWVFTPAHTDMLRLAVHALSVADSAGTRPAIATGGVDGNNDGESGSGSGTSGGGETGGSGSGIGSSSSGYLIVANSEQPRVELDEGHGPGAEAGPGEQRLQHQLVDEAAGEAAGEDLSLMQLLVCCATIVRMFPTVNFLVFFFFAFYYFFLLQVANVQYYYYLSMFSEQVAADLVSIFALIMGIGGFFTSLLMGFLCDRLGLVRFTATITGTSTLTLVLLLIPQPWAQVAMMSLVTISLSAYLVGVLRFVVLYAPAELFGTFNGLQFTLIGILQVALAPAINLLGQDFRLQFLLLGIPTAIGGLALQAFWWAYPPPKLGSVTLGDVLAHAPACCAAGRRK